jgi:hypothetical protein
VLVGPPPPPVGVPVVLLLPVLPMGPNLMLEKITLELGDCASTVAGTPELVEQVPRAAPGVEAVSLVG